MIHNSYPTELPIKSVAFSYLGEVPSTNGQETRRLIILYFYGLDINIKSYDLDDGNTGWVKLKEDGEIERKGFNIKKLAEVIANDLLEGHKVALGFEAPMWYPVPDVDVEGRFQMTARFAEEEQVVTNKKGNPALSKRWYIGGSQPMVKGYPLGLLLFEWMIREYASKNTGTRPLTIKATTDYKSWAEGDDHLLYLYEGFVTGAFKPEDDDFKDIKENGALTNNEVADAFIVADAARVFARCLIQPSVAFPKHDTNLPDHCMSFDNHLRVCVDVNTDQVNSYLTNPNNAPSNVGNPFTPSSPLKAPTRFMSVWKHVIDDANDSCLNEQVRIEFSGKKACDVYGFKFR